MSSKEDNLKEKPKKPPTPQTIPLSKFFSFITPQQKLLLVIGTLSAIVAGFLMPAIGLVLGYVTDGYNPNLS